MMACTQPGGESKSVWHACKVQALMSRHRASGVLGRAANFVGGILIGGIIVLLFWLMVG